MPHHRSVPLAACIVSGLAPTVLPGPAKAETPPATVSAARLDPSAIRSAIVGITAELRDAYVFPDKGAEAAEALETNLHADAYAEMTDPALFARTLTEQLRAVTQDSHMRVIHSSLFACRPAPSVPQGAGFETARLEGDVGYIHLASFVPPKTFRLAADEALRTLADTTAMIVDMRDNDGGHPASVAYLASFFLDPGRRVPINDLVWRNRGTESFQRESFFSSPTPTSYLGKPVYVLVGPRTYSAGEEFAYDLQVLGRATIVGETRRGGANPGGLTELGSDLFAVVPTGRAENPTTGGNWGGVGVRPEVLATLETAQEAALELARHHSRS